MQLCVNTPCTPAQTRRAYSPSHSFRLPPAHPQRGHPARVVNVASKLHYMGAVRKDDLNLQKGYTSLDAYCQSKLLQVLFAGELERRARGRVRSLALHPGEVLTNVVNTLPSPLQRLYRQVMTFPLLTPDQGTQRGARARACRVGQWCTRNVQVWPVPRRKEALRCHAAKKHSSFSSLRPSSRRPLHGPLRHGAASG